MDAGPGQEVNTAEAEGSVIKLTEEKAGTVVAGDDLVNAEKVSHH